MGKYSDPAMFVNKQYEQLNKGLSDMYSNVAKNAQAIKARELKKKQQAAKRMSDWNKIYAKGTQENYQGALDFTSAMPEDSVNTMQFTNQLKSVYKQGYDNIAQMVASGASEGEIASYVQDQINAANTFTEGIVAFDNFQQKYNSGIEKIGQEAGDMKGNEVGDIVVGSQYNNTFSALGIDPGDDKVPLDQLKMVGDLNTGIKFFYDKDGDGKLQEAEVLDLNTMAKNFSGGENPYFKEVEDFTEISKAYKSQLANLEKAPDFVREFSVTENGQTRKVTHVDRKKRQDYFLNENSDGGKLINEIIRTKDATMLAQSIYGYKFAEQFDPTDPVQMKMLKIGLAEKLSPSLFPGSEKLAPSASDRTTVTRTYEDKSPEIAVIENFTKPVHDDVIAFRENPTTNVQKVKDFVGRPYKTGSGDLSAGIISDIATTDNPPTIQVTYAVNGKTEVSRVFNMLENADAKEFESNIINGNFPRAKRERIEGTYDGLISGQGYDDSESTTRVSNRKGTPTLTIEDFEEQISGSDDVISSRSLYESWKSGWAGQPAAPSTPTASTNQNNIAPNQQISYQSFTTPSGVSVNVSKKGYLEDKNDGSTESDIAKVLNWEKENGYSNMGFTGGGGSAKGNANKAAFESVLKQVKSTDPNIPDEEATAVAAEQTVSQYIIGDGSSVTLKGGNTLITADLGIDRAKFDELPGELKHYLIDYKMNSGRSSKDFMMILAGEWDGTLARKNYSDLTNEEKKKYDEFDFSTVDLANITPRQMEIARRRLYQDDGAKAFKSDDMGTRIGGNIEKVDHTIDIKDFPNTGSDADKRKFFIENNILPGDTINGAKVPNY